MTIPQRWHWVTRFQGFHMMASAGWSHTALPQHGSLQFGHRPHPYAAHDEGVRHREPHICLQCRPFTMSSAAVQEIPNSRDNDRTDRPSLASFRIMRTFSSSNLALPFLTPRFARSPHRPLLTESRWLSLVVPRKRWSGRTHGGLSQWCSTRMPGGMGPLCNSQDTRWALSVRQPRPPSPILPYPFLYRAPAQSQQPSSG